MSRVMLGGWGGRRRMRGWSRRGKKREVEVTGTMLMVMRMMMTVTRNPVKGPQRVPGIIVLSFFLRIGPSTSFYLWWAIRFLRSCVPIIKFQTISQSVSLERTRDVTWGEPLMLACMMPCLLRGLDCHWRACIVSWLIFWVCPLLKLLWMLGEFL